MTVFADSSALVKIYVAEDGHEAVVDVPSPIVVSALARVEVPAALWAKHRCGDVALDDALLLVQAFEADYHGDPALPARFVPIDVAAPVLTEAAALAARHGLRALDAVQLASAIAARRVDHGIDGVAVFDRTLRAAFVAERFTPVVGT